MSLYLLKRMLAEDDHAGHDHSGHDHGSHEKEEGEHHDDHDDHDDHGDEVDVDTFKWIMLVLMFLCIGFGIIPKIWGKCRDSETTLSLLNCYSGGLFLGIALIHMLPEGVEIWGGWAIEKGIERPFPLPYVMYFLGYLLILAIDRVFARAYHLSNHGHGEPKNEAINVNMSKDLGNVGS